MNCYIEQNNKTVVWEVDYEVFVMGMTYVMGIWSFLQNSLSEFAAVAGPNDNDNGLLGVII